MTEEEELYLYTAELAGDDAAFEQAVGEEALYVAELAADDAAYEQAVGQELAKTHTQESDCEFFFF